MVHVTCSRPPKWQIFEYLLQIGLDLKHQSDAYWSVLHYSVINSSLSVDFLQKLISKVDIQELDNKGNNALMLHVGTSQPVQLEMVEFLVNYFEVGAQNDYGWTVLHWACQNKNCGSQILQWLCLKVPCHKLTFDSHKAALEIYLQSRNDPEVI